MNTADRVAAVIATLPARMAGLGSPGAVVAVALDGEVQEVAAGLASIDTPAPVTSHTRFGLWSVAKVFTASMFAGLAACGRVDLDAPAAGYLPEIAAAGSGREQITVAHLLSHTSGIDGDAVVDLGDGDDCRQRYVRGLGRVAQLFPPGRAYAYSNAGYLVLGALAERVTGETWERLIESMILTRAGLSSTTVRGVNDTTGPVASAHVHDQHGRLRTTANQYAPWRSCAPAGSSTYATAADLARFGALHLPATSGSAALSEVLPGVAALQRPVLPVPGFAYEQRTSCLGWKSLHWPGTRVLAHDGGSHTFLRVLLDAGLSVAVMCNGPDGLQLAQPLIADLAEAATGAPPPPAPSPSEIPAGLDLSRYAGSYHAAGMHATIAHTGKGLALRLPGRVTEPVPLLYVAPTTFTANSAVISFVDFDQAGTPRMISIGASRVAIRVDA